MAYDSSGIVSEPWYDAANCLFSLSFSDVVTLIFSLSELDQKLQEGFQVALPSTKPKLLTRLTCVQDAETF